jgi:hypothetical protein
MAQVEAALRDLRRPPAVAIDRVRAWAGKDAADLEPELRRRTAAARDAAAADLSKQGEREAEALRALIVGQRDRISRAVATPEDLQMKLFEDAEQRREEEVAQLRRDRLHWRRKLESLEQQIETEPARLRDSYAVKADRVEIVGLLYLWPESN